ncbi:uncharacterized protein LAJ45_04575 [Morchella importuna]|uniref:uncharacterized protein n=1 Tax=Morchella importuna TaxID=1174673 RepID=UPI001E8DC76B|nr:uncharacterized protein LAJ45_04575 [Morchella importuna]KAH8151373.1 hypothetical protein LAJ45_04575 [Morchella importuna]
MILIPREADIPFNLTQTASTSNYINGSFSSSTATDNVVENIGSLLTIPTITLITITSVVVSSRMYSRAVLLGFVGADDYSILAATAAAVGLTVTVCLSVNYGVGKHAWDVPILNFIDITKLAYISQILYLISLGFTKASLNLLLLRLSPTDRIIKLTWTIFAITTAATISMLMASIFQCTPIHYGWERMNPMSTVKGTCVGYALLQYSIQGINIVTDLVLWLLPLRLIMQAQLPKRQKWGLYIVFMLGCLAPVASIARLIMLVQMLVLKPILVDPSWKSGVNISVWSIVEVNIAIICSSIPTIRPLLKKLVPTLLGTIENIRNSKKDRASGYQNWATQTKGDSIPLGSVERVDKTSEGIGNVGVVTVTRTEVGTSFYDNHSVDFPVPGSSHGGGGKKEAS